MILTMISTEEIKKLAELARIDVEPEEQQKLASEMDAILEYVGQIKSVTEGESTGVPSTDQGEGDTIVRGEVNVMREDENPTEAGTHSQQLIAEFPNKEGDYLKVKKIL